MAISEPLASMNTFTRLSRKVKRHSWQKPYVSKKKSENLINKKKKYTDHFLTKNK